MTLRDIINKEFEVLNEDKKTTKKVINIFYKLNINLIKPQTENKEQENNQVQQQPQQQEPAQQQTADQGANCTTTRYGFSATAVSCTR